MDESELYKKLGELTKDKDRWEERANEGDIDDIAERLADLGLNI